MKKTSRTSSPRPSSAGPFYTRLEYYRLLEQGCDPEEARRKLPAAVTPATLRKWRQEYDPARGPYGAAPEVSGGADRGEILAAMRRQALEGNVTAAKLLLSEYPEAAPEAGALTVEQAIALLKKWDSGAAESQAAEVILPGDERHATAPESGQ